jgi:flagellar protein FliS
MIELATRTYQTNRDANVAGVEVLSQLFTKIIGAIDAAKVAAENGRIEERHQLVSKATAALMGLRQALDLERGGTIALSLDRLYQFAVLRLTEFEIKNDVRHAEEAISVLAPIGESWRSLANERPSRPEASQLAARHARSGAATAPGAYSLKI